MTVVKRFCIFHHSILLDHLCNVTVPKGYVFRTSSAGRFPEMQVRVHLCDFNIGCANIAVQVEAVGPLTFMTTLRDQLDGDDGRRSLFVGPTGRGAVTLNGSRRNSGEDKRLLRKRTDLG